MKRLIIIEGGDGQGYYARIEDGQAQKAHQCTEIGRAWKKDFENVPQERGNVPYYGLVYHQTAAA